MSFFRGACWKAEASQEGMQTVLESNDQLQQAASALDRVEVSLAPLDMHVLIFVATAGFVGWWTPLLCSCCNCNRQLDTRTDLTAPLGDDNVPELVKSHPVDAMTLRSRVAQELGPKAFALLQNVTGHLDEGCGS